MAHITNYTHGTATLCKARSGLAWHGDARSGVARLQGEIPALCSKVGIMKYYTDEVRRGLARSGLAWRGWARQGGAVQGMVSRSFAPALYSIFTNLSQIILEVWCGQAGSGPARFGEVRHGKARSAGDIPLLYIQLSQIILLAGQGQAWRGGAVRGEVWLGPARLGKGTGLQNPVHYA